MRPEGTSLPEEASLSDESIPRVSALANLAHRCHTESVGGVDELGLAAVLESWGITDSTARSRFGEPDVFTLAAELRTRLAGDGQPERPSAPETPWIRLAWVLRAVAYLPPTLFVVIALSSSTNVASGAAFAAITCFGWGMAEGVSRVAYTSISAGGVAAMRRSESLAVELGHPRRRRSRRSRRIVDGFDTGSTSRRCPVAVPAAVGRIASDGTRFGAGFWITPPMVLATALAVGGDELGSVLVVAIVCEVGSDSARLAGAWSHRVVWLRCAQMV